MDMGRTWIEDFFILEEGDIATMSISKNHLFLSSNKYSKKNLFKRILENDPTEPIMFNNAICLIIDIKVYRNPLCHDMIGETHTIKELENKRTKKEGWINIQVQ